MLTVFSVVGELSTEDPHLVGYVSDTITLPCEHTVAETDLLTVYWTKDIVKVVAEYEKGDDIPVRFHDSMEGRVNAEVFPPTLKFSRCSLKDAGVYQCTVIPVKGDPITLHYTLAVNGRYLETPVPRHVYIWSGLCLVYVRAHKDNFALVKVDPTICCMCKVLISISLNYWNTLK